MFIDMKTNLEKAIDFLWNNRKSYEKKILNGDEPSFSFPDYGGLPEEIHQELTAKEIIAIQHLWSELLKWDAQTHNRIWGFKEKSKYCSAIKKNIREQRKQQVAKVNSSNVNLGDFIAWAIKNEWWVRGFDEIHRVDCGETHGWGFTFATQTGFVSDKSIRKYIPKKTIKEWDRWGR
jgi:hypothetical protein